MPLSTTDKEPLIRITLFGGLSIRPTDGPQTELPPQQSAALLAYLALNMRRPQSRETLLTLFWPDSEPEKAQQNLRRCLVYLRDLLEGPPFSRGSVLLTTRTSIQLNPQVVSTDAAEFERVVEAAGRSEAQAERIDLLSRAVEIYRGELLPGFYQDCFVLEQNRLAERHFEALRLLVTTLEAAGSAQQALPYARRAVALDPLLEEAHCALMRLYAAMGQPAAVQRQYLELESRLQGEFGEAPSEATMRLASRLQAAACRYPAARHESDVPTAVTRSSDAVLNDAVLNDAVLTLSEDANALPAIADHLSPPSWPCPVPSVPRRILWPAPVIAVAGFAVLSLFIWQAHRALPSSRPVSASAPSPRRVATAVTGRQRFPKRPVDERRRSSRPASAKQPGVTFSPGRSATHASPLRHLAAATRVEEPKSTARTPRTGRDVAGSQPASRPMPISAPDALWATAYHSMTGDSVERDSEPSAMVVDASCNIYVTGFIQTVNTDVDYLTLKVSPEGKVLWHRRYNGPGNDVDRAKSIAVDSTGNVYVTGESDGGKGHGQDRLSGLDIATIKYGSDGKPSPTWPNVGFGVGVRRYAGPADGRDSGRKVVLDSAGDAYVCGYSRAGNSNNNDSGIDLILIKYDVAGRERWVKRYPAGLPNLYVATVDMARSSRGDLVLTGCASGSDNVSIAMTLQIQPNGYKRWESLYGGQGGLGAAPTCVVLDQQDNVYVVGHEEFITPLGDHGAAYLILKYDPTGKLLWQKTNRWLGYGIIQLPAAAVVDGFNGLCVTGTIYAESASHGCGTLRYASNGDVTWADPYRSPGHGGQSGQALGINSTGDVFVSGIGAFLDPIVPTDDTIEMTTLEYSSSIGKARLRDRFVTPGGTLGPTLIAIDRSDSFIQCGRTFVGKTPQITIVKYLR